MGSYTEFFFRAHLKPDTPKDLVDWLDSAANGDPDDPVPEPFDGSAFFADNRRWSEIFFPGGAVYQISRNVQFKRAERAHEWHELIILSSSKGCSHDEYLLEWLRPWLAHSPGDFLGWTLSEDSKPSENDYFGRRKPGEPDNEQPTLIFMPAAEVVNG